MALWMGIVLAWFGLAVAAALVLGPILHGLDRPTRIKSASAGRAAPGRAAEPAGRRHSTHVA